MVYGCVSLSHHVCGPNNVGCFAVISLCHHPPSPLQVIVRGPLLTGAQTGTAAAINLCLATPYPSNSHRILTTLMREGKLQCNVAFVHTQDQCNADDMLTSNIYIYTHNNVTSVSLQLIEEN